MDKLAKNIQKPWFQSVPPSQTSPPWISPKKKRRKVSPLQIRFAHLPATSGHQVMVISDMLTEKSDDSSMMPIVLFKKHEGSWFICICISTTCFVGFSRYPTFRLGFNQKRCHLKSFRLTQETAPKYGFVVQSKYLPTTTTTTTTTSSSTTTRRWSQNKGWGTASTHHSQDKLLQHFLLHLEPPVSQEDPNHTKWSLWYLKPTGEYHPKIKIQLLRHGCWDLIGFFLIHLSRIFQKVFFEKWRFDVHHSLETTKPNCFCWIRNLVFLITRFNTTLHNEGNGPTCHAAWTEQIVAPKSKILTCFLFCPAR